MYKVFYNDRTVFFIDTFKKHFDKKEGLFYKFKDKNQLKNILNLFLETPDVKNLFVYHKDIDYTFTEFSSSYTIVEAAGGLVKTPDDRILIIKRHGLWDLPKGKIECNEKSKICAIREVEEECGISNLKLSKKIVTTYHTYTLDNKPMLKKSVWYEMLHNGDQIPTPQIKEDITEAKWINRNDVVEVIQNTYLSIIEVLKKGKVID